MQFNPLQYIPTGKAWAIATVALATTLNIPQSISAIQVEGFSLINDGGASIYYRAPVQAAGIGKFQSLDGAYWQLSVETGVNVAMFGAIGGSDETAKIQDAITYANAQGCGRLDFLDNAYQVTSLNVPTKFILNGQGKGKTTITFTSATSGMVFENVERSGASNMTVFGPNAETATVHIKSTNGFCIYPIFENFDVSSSGPNGRGMFYDVQGVNPIFFPRHYNVNIDGGTFAPNVSNRIGIEYGGAGSTITVGPQYHGMRVTNTRYGIINDKVDTTAGFGVEFDAQTNGSGGGIGIWNKGANATYNRFYGTRFEQEAVDVFVLFDTGSADNYVEGVLASAAPAKIVDNGIRNAWEGSDGSGGLDNKYSGPINFAGGIKLKAGSLLDHYSEGLFNPTIFGSSSAGTCVYDARAGEYTKIGNKVFISAQVQYSAHTGTGSINMGNMPFAAKVTPNLFRNFAVKMGNIPFTGPIVDAIIQPGETSINISQVSTLGTSSGVPLSASGFLSVSGFYTV